MYPTVRMRTAGVKQSVLVNSLCFCLSTTICKRRKLNAELLMELHSWNSTWDTGGPRLRFHVWISILKFPLFHLVLLKIVACKSTMPAYTCIYMYIITRVYVCTFTSSERVHTLASKPLNQHCVRTFQVDCRQQYKVSMFTCIMTFTLYCVQMQ